jgi:hypothetical protein
MRRDVLTLTAHGMTLGEIGRSIPRFSHYSDRPAEQCLNQTDFQGFPIVKNSKRPLLVGYVDRTLLLRALSKSRYPAERVLNLA